jgi:transposase
VDTSKQVLGEVRTRRRWTIEEKRRITQETLVPGASVARIAQRYALNANQLFQWRKKYREGRLGSRVTPKLLPVTIADERLVEAEKVAEPVSAGPLGTLEIRLPRGTVHITGRVELQTLRAAIESLLQ